MTLLCKFRKRRLWRKQSRSHKCKIVERIAGEETSSLRQSAGILQAGEKQPENDVSGRVSESRKCFSIGDTVSGHIK